MAKKSGDEDSHDLDQSGSFLRFNQFNSPNDSEGESSPEAENQTNFRSRHFQSKQLDFQGIKNVLGKYASGSSEQEEMVYDSESVLHDIQSKYLPHPEERSLDHSEYSNQENFINYDTYLQDSNQRTPVTIQSSNPRNQISFEIKNNHGLIDTTQFRLDSADKKTELVQKIQADEKAGELGQLVTVRNYVRRDSSESFSGFLPTPNMPESPDTTRQITDQQNDFLVSQINPSLTVQQQNIRVSNFDQENDILGMKQSIENIYNQKFKNLEADYRMKETMHLELIRELRKQSEQLNSTQAQEKIPKETPEELQTREKLQKTVQDQEEEIKELHLKVRQLEAEIQRLKDLTEKISNESEKNLSEALREKAFLETICQDLRSESKGNLRKIKDLEEARKKDQSKIILLEEQEKKIGEILDQREQQLAEKYRDLEDHLTTKFRIETGLFFDNMKKEMEEILANKGLTKSRLTQIEFEVKQELMKQQLRDEKLKENLIDTERKRVSKTVTKSGSRSPASSSNSDLRKNSNAIGQVYMDEENLRPTLLNSDEQEIQMIQEEMRINLEAELRHKEAQLVEQYQEREKRIKHEEKQLADERSELARQKSLLNVRMTKLAKDLQEVKGLKISNKKKFEKEIRDEYQNIQLEAEHLRREVESCYKQLHTLQSSSTEKFMLSRKKNAPSVQNSSNQKDQERSPAIRSRNQYQSQSKERSRSRKSYSGLKAAIGDRSISGNPANKKNHLAISQAQRSLDQSQNSQYQMVESVERQLDAFGEPDYGKSNLNYVRRLSLDDGDNEKWELYASGSINIQEGEYEISGGNISRKYVSRSGTEDQPTFGSRINYESTPLHNVISSEREKGSAQQLFARIESGTGKFGVAYQGQKTSSETWREETEFGSYNSKEINITDHGIYEDGLENARNQSAEINENFSEDFNGEYSDEKNKFSEDFEVVQGDKSLTDRLLSIPNLQDYQDQYDKTSEKKLKESFQNSKRLIDQEPFQTKLNSEMYSGSPIQEARSNSISQSSNPLYSYVKRQQQSFPGLDASSVNQSTELYSQTPGSYNFLDIREERFRRSISPTQSNPFSTPKPARYNLLEAHSDANSIIRSEQLPQLQTHNAKSKKLAQDQGSRKHASSYGYLHNFEKKTKLRSPSRSTELLKNRVSREPNYQQRAPFYQEEDKENQKNYANFSDHHPQKFKKSIQEGDQKTQLLRDSEKKRSGHANESQRTSIRNYVNRILVVQKSAFDQHQSRVAKANQTFDELSTAQNKQVKNYNEETRIDNQVRHLLSQDYVLSTSKQGDHHNKEECISVSRFEVQPTTSQRTNIQQYLDNTLNLKNPTQFGFNILDRVFDTSNGVIKDSQKSLQLKSLRQEILNLRLSDTKLLPKTILKIAQLSSKSFLLKIPGFEEFCVHYSRKLKEGKDGHSLQDQSRSNDVSLQKKLESGEHMVKDCFIGLEDIWKKMMISQHSKMKFLKSLACSRNFSEFFQALNTELEHLVAYSNKHRRIVDLLEARETAKLEFSDACIFFRNINEIREFVGAEHVKNCIYAIKKISKKILEYASSCGTGSIKPLRSGVEIESLKYYGIGVDVIAKLDLWEIDYISQVEAEYRILFGQ